MFSPLLLFVAATSGAADTKPPCYARAYSVTLTIAEDQFTSVMIQRSGDLLLHVRHHPTLPDGYYSGCLLPRDALLLSCMITDLDRYFPRPDRGYCPHAPSFRVGTVDGVNTSDRSYSCCLADLPENPLHVVADAVYTALCHAVSHAFAPRHPIFDHEPLLPIQDPPCIEWRLAQE